MLLTKFLSALQPINEWVQTQTSLWLYGSSLLLTYEAKCLKNYTECHRNISSTSNLVDECKTIAGDWVFVKMIDFSYVFSAEDKSINTNYLFGIDIPTNFLPNEIIDWWNYFSILWVFHLFLLTFLANFCYSLIVIMLNGWKWKIKKNYIDDKSSKSISFYLHNKKRYLNMNVREWKRSARFFFIKVKQLHAMSLKVFFVSLSCSCLSSKCCSIAGHELPKRWEKLWWGIGFAREQCIRQISIAPWLIRFRQRNCWSSSLFLK